MYIGPLLVNASVVSTIFEPFDDDERHAAHTTRSEQVFARYFTVAWAVAFALVVARHELWRDELQAWTIARGSSSVPALFDSLRYEGHPPAWYLPLWVIARFTRDPVALKYVAWLVGVTSTWLTARFAPFPRVGRCLLAVGYFPLFEYGAISRSYGVAYLVVLLVLRAATKRCPNWVEVGLLLALLANVVVTAIPLVCVLAVALALDSARSYKDKLSMATLAGAGVIASLVLSRPPADGLYAQWNLKLERSDLTSLARVPWHALVPLPRPTTGLWNTYLLDGHPWAEAILGVLVVICGAVVFRRARQSLIVWLGGIGLFLAMTHLRALPLYARQEGMIWLAGFAASWLLWSYEVPPSRTGVRFLTAALIVGACGGLLIAANDFARPFSGSPQAASWVSDHVSEPYELLCDSAYKCSAVSARLDKSAYASATSEPFTFVVWRVGREADVQPGNAAAEARALSARTGHRVLVLLDEAPPLGAGLQVLFRTPRAMSDEQYWICALE